MKILIIISLNNYPNQKKNATDLPDHLGQRSWQQRCRWIGQIADNLQNRMSDGDGMGKSVAGGQQIGRTEEGKYP